MQAWLDDAKHPRDWNGPRGQIQLKVYVRTSLEEYEDLQRGRRLKRTERMGKATEQKLQERMQAVVADAALEEQDVLDWQSLRRETAEQMGEVWSFPSLCRGRSPGAFVDRGSQLR